MTHDYGRFVWFELVAKDEAAGARFYGEVIGWKVQPMDMPGGMKYPMIMAGQTPIGGIAPPQDSASPHWVSYVSVEDVDASAKKVKKLGGALLAPAFDVPTVGRMQPVADPQGAKFFLFHNANGDSEPAQGEGSFHWNELSTDDPEAAVAFYEKAFGYTHETMDMGMGAYFVLKNGDALRGGAMKAQTPAPAHWLQYATVEDCDAAAARAKKAGGQIVVPPSDIPGVGRIAAVVDPLGATMGIIKPASA